ncbi:MAG: bifunctional 4-hydroxy-2-oxoglutarate aldolase/2-dehydro-3-deoxy-phosphogluconate aldolase [Caulobacteraceae bacterium]|nr:bifunctional 4-hydroxy-2-oxoglutarate aldolase/2-dehydro-3-deoxy-phosphogluconate aldolase [Caulobacteraceae bacterium]
MTDASPTTADALMRVSPVIPVLTIERLEDAVPLARALVAGGLPVLEVTLRTPVALEAITRMAEAAPEAIVGAGTVLNPGDYERAAKAGARFIVSPGLTEPLIAAARAAPLPFLPGVATASDLMRGLDAGLNRFKFFPAETSGGAPALKALYGPFGECRFCPTGGVGENTAPAYLSLPNVLCVGGAWVAPADAVRAGDWDRITTLARAAAALRQEPVA